MELTAPDAAELLGVDPKRLRDFLREKYPELAPGTGGDWVVTAAMLIACARHFA